MRQAITLILLCGVMAACGGQAATTGPQSTQPQVTNAPTAAPVPPAASSTPPPAAAGGGIGSTAHVEVASGPQAGTYDATGAKVDCNIAGDGSGATYQDLEKTDGLTGLTFISGEGGASPNKIYFQAFLGPVAASQVVLEISTLDPSSARGKGTAHLDDKGATIKWTIDGATADGVTIKATIECGPVDRR